MRLTVPRMVLLGLAGVVSLALGLVPATATAAPTLTLTQSCDSYPPYHAIDIRIEGLSPNESFTGTLEWFDESGNYVGGVGPGTFYADENGVFDWPGFWGFGITTPQTYKATVEWSGGTLEATKHSDCTLPGGAPTANAGVDQTVASEALVNLDGSGSTDPDGDPLTYEWTQTDGPPVSLSGAATATPTFTAPTGAATLGFELEACDDGTPPLCDTDPVTVRVQGPPVTEPPTVTLTANCDDYPFKTSIDISVQGIPGYETFTGTLKTFDDSGTLLSTLGPLLLGADENGSFVQSLGARSGDTYEMTVESAGGTVTKSLTVNCEPPENGNDYAATVIVNRPTWASGGGHRNRGFVVKVTNLGNDPLTVSEDDIAAEVLVNGSATGAVEFVSSKVTKPGERVKFRYAWRYEGVAVGDDVEYSGCVNAAGDPNAGNDCDSHLTTAEAKP
ncbi:MAG TPA: PKD domain-containing protein [Solirubrobacterales bacterium]|nr:PKD domain-containing protein [Solirubrobacterales bacterium]